MASAAPPASRAPVCLRRYRRAPVPSVLRHPGLAHSMHINGTQMTYYSISPFAPVHACVSRAVPGCTASAGPRRLFRGGAEFGVQDRDFEAVGSPRRAVGRNLAGLEGLAGTDRILHKVLLRSEALGSRAQE